MAENTNTHPLFGKAWKNHSIHDTHAAALGVKNSLEGDDVNVKIRRTAENKFRVKTRASELSIVSAKKKPKTEEKKGNKSPTRAGRRAERERRKKSQKS